MAEAPHHLAIREQLNEQREALADLDALLQSSKDDNGEIQEVHTFCPIPCIAKMDVVQCAVICPMT